MERGLENPAADKAVAVDPVGDILAADKAVAETAAAADVVVVADMAAADMAAAGVAAAGVAAAVADMVVEDSPAVAAAEILAVPVAGIPVADNLVAVLVVDNLAAGTAKVVPVAVARQTADQERHLDSRPVVAALLQLEFLSVQARKEADCAPRLRASTCR